MIIRLTYLASALSLASAAAGGKADKPTPSPSQSQSQSPSSKADKPTPSPSSKANKPPPSSKAGKENYYFIAPFSCGQRCISAQDAFVGEPHFLDDAVQYCSSESEYQKWKVHEYGSVVKFERVARYDQGMCLAVVPQEMGNAHGQFGDPSAYWFFPMANFVEMCSGKLGLAECDHPGTEWYFTGGQFLSAACWASGYSATMSVDDECSKLKVSLKENAVIKSSHMTFMLLETDFIEDIVVTSQAPSESSAPSESHAPSESSVASPPSVGPPAV